MSFGWAPPEELVRQGRERKIDFFSRLEADRQRNDVRSKNSTQKDLKKRKNCAVTVHDVLNLMLDSLRHRPAQKSRKEKKFLLGDLTLILSIREEIHQRLQAADPADALFQKPVPDVEPHFYSYVGSSKALRCLILQAALYKEEIVRCTTSQQFYDHLRTSFLDLRKLVATNSVTPGFLAITFLLAWIDFLRADFNSFAHHMDGVIVALQSYKNALNGTPFPPTISYLAMVSCMSDSCIGFFGDRQRFPADLIPPNLDWLDIYVHRDEIPRALICFGRAEWMRTIANFKRWAQAQRAAAGNDNSFVEEAIARQGDAITADIVAWGERNIPKYEEISTSSEDTLVPPGCTEYSSHFRHPLSSIDKHKFLNFPRVQFQNDAHNEMTLMYVGLLLLVSYCAYPQAGHLPFSRWELAVKFCQCFAAYPVADEMDPINRILHLFYARITFDDSFPQERLWCDYQWTQMKASQRHGQNGTDVTSCFIAYMEREWGLAET